jgi:hypothetical protein
MRSMLRFAGTGASARQAAIAQMILVAQLILFVEAILIEQTILVSLARLIGACQRRRGDGHDQCDDNEQKQQLFHRFLPFCYSGGGVIGRARRLCAKVCSVMETQNWPDGYGHREKSRMKVNYCQRQMVRVSFRAYLRL